MVPPKLSSSKLFVEVFDRGRKQDLMDQLCSSTFPKMSVCLVGRLGQLPRSSTICYHPFKSRLLPLHSFHIYVRTPLSGSSSRESAFSTLLQKCRRRSKKEIASSCSLPPCSRSKVSSRLDFLLLSCPFSCLAAISAACRSSRSTARGKKAFAASFLLSSRQKAGKKAES